MKPLTLAAILGLSIASCNSLAATAPAPQILVTLKPLHALVSGLTDGISQPTLLLDGMQSPHDYQLKPSERRLFESATVVVYASDNIESFIQPLRRSLGKQRFIALDKLPGMPLLPARGSDTHHHADYDGHIWLSPVNASHIVRQLADMLATLDSANKANYFNNRDRLLQKLETLHRQVDQQLLLVRDQSFLQFHDALQYFERDYALTNGITVTSGSEHAPGARHVRALKQAIKAKKISCFLYEPPQPKLLQTLDVNKNATMQALEIHGSQIAAGEELYFKLIHSIATNIHDCLQHQKEP